MLSERAMELFKEIHKQKKNAYQISVTAAAY